MAAAASAYPHDHSSDWVAELQRLTAESVSLPAAARLAVIATIDSIEREDGVLPPPAAHARTALAGPATRHTPTSAHSLANTLLAALKPRHQREPSSAQQTYAA
jgi:hypothetical protein